MRRGGGEDIILEGFLLCPWKFQTKQGFILGKSTKLGYSRKKANSRVFQIVLRGGGIRNFAGGIFLPGEGNLRRSDFDNSNLFQS